MIKSIADHSLDRMVIEWSIGVFSSDAWRCFMRPNSPLTYLQTNNKQLSLNTCTMKVYRAQGYDRSM